MQEFHVFSQFSTLTFIKKFTTRSGFMICIKNLYKYNLCNVLSTFSVAFVVFSMKKGDVFELNSISGRKLGEYFQNFCLFLSLFRA